MSRVHEDREGQVATETRPKEKLKRPKLYKVLLHNDDYTTMEFVTAILRVIFALPETDAGAIMWHIHTNGIGVAGVFAREIAETKVAEVTSAAEDAEYPLLCTMQVDDGPASSDDK